MNTYSSSDQRKNYRTLKAANEMATEQDERTVAGKMTANGVDNEPTRPSDTINFSHFPHHLNWNAQKVSYDSLMRQTYFSLTDTAIKNSHNSAKRDGRGSVTAQDILREMKSVAGAKNVPHYMQYPTGEHTGTVSNEMIKQKNVQQFMENPKHFRQMIADAFLIKIANDNMISEADREAFAQKAAGAGNAQELHEYMAEMTYHNRSAYEAFHRMLAESESLYAKMRNGQREQYGYITELYDRRDAEMQSTIKDQLFSHHYDGTDAEKPLIGAHMRIATLVHSELQSLREQFPEADVTDAMTINEAVAALEKEVLNEYQNTSKNDEFKPYFELQDLRGHVKQIDSSATLYQLETCNKNIVQQFEFGETHRQAQEFANRVLIEMNRSDTFDMSPYEYIVMTEPPAHPGNGAPQHILEHYERELSEYQEDVSYNRGLVQRGIKAAVEGFGMRFSEEQIGRMADTITRKLYVDGRAKGGYRDALKDFADAHENDPEKMTIFSDLNSIATTVVRDAIYNEVFEESLRTPEGKVENAVWEELTSNGERPVIDINEKIAGGSYATSIAANKDDTEAINRLMNKATLFSKVVNNEIDNTQARGIIDKTAIFSDMDPESREALKQTVDDVYAAKDERDIKDLYRFWEQHEGDEKKRLKDDAVATEILSFIKESENRSRFSVGKMFRNNRAFLKLTQCAQSGITLDRNADTVSSNLKGCMEKYRDEVERGFREKEDQMNKLLSSPFGALNGVLIGIMLTDHAMAGSEYQYARRRTSEIHSRILEILSYSQSAHDQKNDKARTTVMSSLANNGIALSTIASAVKDRFIDEMTEEKLTETVHRNAIAGRNVFANENLAIRVDPSLEQFIPSDEFKREALTKLTADRAALRERMDALQPLLAKLDTMMEVDIDKVFAEGTRVTDELRAVEEQIAEIEAALERGEVVPGGAEKLEALKGSKTTLSGELSALTVQYRALEAFSKAGGNAQDVLNEAKALEKELRTVNANIEKIEQALHHAAEARATIRNDKTLDLTSENVSIETLRELSEALRRQGIALAESPSYGKRENAMIEEIVAMREKIAFAMLRKGAVNGLDNEVKELYAMSFGATGIAEGRSLGGRTSDLEHTKEALSTNSFISEFKTVYRMAVGPTKAEKEALSPLNDDGSMNKEAFVQLKKSVDSRIAELEHKIADAKVAADLHDSGQLLAGQEHRLVHEEMIGEMKRDLEKLKNQQNRLPELERDLRFRLLVIEEVDATADRNKRELEKISEQLRHGSREEIAELAGRMSGVADRLADDERNIVSRAVSKMGTEGYDLTSKGPNGDENSFEKVVQAEQNRVSEVGSNLGDKVLKYEERFEAIAGLGSEELDGSSIDAVRFANNMRDVYQSASPDVMESVRDAAGITVREMENSTQDNTSSLLVVTNARAMMLEEARQEAMDRGDRIATAKYASILNEHTKGFNFSVESVEANLANARSARDATRVSIAEQTGRQYMAAAEVTSQPQYSGMRR